MNSTGIRITFTFLLLLEITLVLQLAGVNGRSYLTEDDLYDPSALSDLTSDSQDEFVLPLNDDGEKGKAIRETADDLQGLMEIFGQTTTPASKHGKKGLAKDEHGRVQMGVASDQCDDAKTNLTVDWDGSVANYTCFHPETRFPQSPYLQPLQECEVIPDAYRPEHFCMDKQIHYKHNIPSSGDHRPLWPKFGEYLYVPTQRWLHNIEHGAVVMLYHPCAHPMEVKRLRSIVTRCFGKHVITPSTLLPPERPLALVAWGCRLQMSLVDDNIAEDFIRQKALHGPEGNYPKEGQFDQWLIKFANETGNADYSRVTC
ncbi:unnamed protein product [Allacma fusca]|uniref:Uncharacterized protein n=1 Tax=Allacma fusca TaxID=39272 RepID=A0A8J2PUH3_9HEXA|nr:unnamed protein product [Allacma fusca]